MILPVLLAALAASTPHSRSHASPTPPPPVATPAPAAGPTLAEPTISPKSEEACGLLVQKEAGKNEYLAAAGLKVLGGPMNIVLPKAESPISAVSCKRDTIVPGPGDGRVLWILGKPLILTDGANRKGELQMVKGKFQFLPVQGELTAPEKDAVVARLNILQANFEMLLVQSQKAAADKAKAAGEAPVATKK